MKTHSERTAIALANWKEDTGSNPVLLSRYVEAALYMACAELVDEIATMIGSEPAVNAMAFENMIRDHFGAK